MNFLREMWAIIVSMIVTLFTNVNNEVLITISNLLTILILLIGLFDWIARRKSGAKEKTNKKTDERQVFDRLESYQKPFRAVKMLDNPMETSEVLGNTLEQTITILRGKKMKKVFKWIWYNKEQLLSIAYQVVLLAVANIVLFTDGFNSIVSTYIGVELPLWAKIVAVILALGLTALSVRNVIVTYGLSSLDTIDAVLKERAEAKMNKLSPEQKQIYKDYITALNDTLARAKKELSSIEEEYTKLTVLYNADNSLVSDFTSKTVQYQNQIASGKEKVASLEDKIAYFKALLSGQQVK